MNILQVNDLTKIFITNTIFEHINFSINEGQKVALVGPNGTGKSTLMKCLIGTEDIDDGSIIFAKGTTIGYLDQHVVLDLNKNLREVILDAFEDLLLLYKEIRAMEKEISEEVDPDKQQALLETYHQKQTQYEEKGGFEIESRVKGIALGLGFSEEDLERNVESFSGGERTRIMLARQLARSPEFLLLDEPTNHLDLPAIEWLEVFLRNYRGTVMVISHDEYFLNAVVDMVLDLENRGMTVYPMGFFKYKEEKVKQRALQHKRFIEQQKKLAKEREYIERNRAGVNSKQARGREQRLKREVILDDVTNLANMKIGTYDVSETARFVLTVSHLDVVVPDKVLATDLSFDLQFREKVAIIGRNGVGKTTLLKTVLEAIRNEDRTHVQLGNRVKFAYFDQHQEILDESKTILQQTLDSCDMKVSEAKTLLARYLFREDDLEREISRLSGGEKVRLSLMILLFEKPNFLILDEPTNHLDIESKEIVINFLNEFDGSILVVSHDRELLNEVTTRTIELTDGVLTSYPGNYTYYKEKKELLEAIALENQKQVEKKKEPVRKKKQSISKSKLKEEIAKYELEIEELEEKIDELNQALTEPGARYSVIAEELHASNERLDEVMVLWQEKSELLEEAQSGE